MSLRVLIQDIDLSQSIVSHSRYCVGYIIFELNQWLVWMEGALIGSNSWCKLCLLDISIANWEMIFK